MKIRKFAILDITFLSIIALLSEFIGAKVFTSNMFYISFAQIFLLIVVVRWRVWALIPITLISFIRVFIFGATNFTESIIYFLPMFSLGLSVVALKMGWFKNINKNRITGLLYYSLFYMLFFLITGILTTILISQDYSFINEIFKYVLSYVMGLIIMYAFSGQKTMLIDMVDNYQKNKEGK